jgi:hypothetical protein
MKTPAFVTAGTKCVPNTFMLKNIYQKSTAL